MMFKKEGRVLLFAAAVFLGVFGGLARAQAAPKPNIVHVLTDDLGWLDVAANYRAVHGTESMFETPNIDRIAKNGMRFMRAYSPAPTCAPSRAAYMAGQSTLKTGVLHVLGGWPTRARTGSHKYIDPAYSGRLSLETPTIAQVLKDAGYTTGHIQKFHFGGANHGFPGPLDYGFDFSWTTKPGSPYNDPELWDPTDRKRADYQGIWAPLKPHRLANFPSSHDPEVPYSLDADDRPFDSVVDLSVRWMNKIHDNGKPFFLNFCPSFVHGPIGTRDRKRLAYYCKKMGFPFPTDPGRVTDKQKGQVNPYYAAMIDSLDWQVGKILTFLETNDDPRNPGHKLIDNTYIMVSSDNGGATHGSSSTGMEAVADNRPLRNGKKSVFEGGLRIPFIIQGPGIKADSANHTPINLIDMLPTYLAMAGEQPQRKLDIDGCNVLPVMLGQDDQARFADGRVRDSMCYAFPIEHIGSSVIRKGNWKLIMNHVPEMNGLPEVQLYQLYNADGSDSDLSEQHNLADAKPEKRSELLRELNAWLEKHQAPLPYKNAQLTGTPLAGTEQVPAVLEIGSTDDRLEMRVETGPKKAKIVEARLIYTTNGSDELRPSKHYEEWFAAPATVRPDGAEAIAPPGMTHGILYLRDANGFMVSSELLQPRMAPGSDIWAKGTEFISDGFAYRPGLVALIKTGLAARSQALSASLDTATLDDVIEAAQATIAQPVEETPYALAMRNLRAAILALNVPEAKLPALNQFRTDKWRTALTVSPASAKGENAPRETADAAFDGDPKTKWLDLSPAGSWIQYRYPKPGAVVTGYAITSANDGQERDPQGWQLLGSNDGKTWTTLDSKTGELWSQRLEMRNFSFANKTAYRIYRLNISAVRDMKTANSVQIAEIRFVQKSQLVQNLEAGKKQTLVTFGTSLTKIGAWVPQLATVLEQHYPDLANVINGAQGGANSAWGVGALEKKVLQHKPDTVLIEFAVNDAVASRKTTVDMAQANLEDIITRLLKLNSNCEIILMVMNPPAADTRLKRPNLPAYNQMYRDVAKARGFQLIDHYPVWEKLLREDPLAFFRYMPDTIHPVREGALSVITPTMLWELGIPDGDPRQSNASPCWDYLFHVMDKDRSRDVSRDEFHIYWGHSFKRQDANRDGILQPEELLPAGLFGCFDTNNDGKVATNEYRAAYDWHFAHHDKNQDGRVFKGELWGRPKP